MNLLSTAYDIFSPYKLYFPCVEIYVVVVGMGGYGEVVNIVKGGVQYHILHCNNYNYAYFMCPVAYLGHLRINIVRVALNYASLNQICMYTIRPNYPLNNDTSFNQDTIHGPSYIEKCTKLPLK